MHSFHSVLELFFYAAYLSTPKVAVLTNDGSKLAGPEFVQYSAQPHPDVPSGAYAVGGPLHPENQPAPARWNWRKH